MKLLLTCIKGLEQTAIDEVKELTKKKATIVIPSKLALECKEPEAGFLIYNTRSLIYITEFLAEGKIKTIEDVKALAKTIDFKKIIKTNFVVKCNREGQHDFHSVDVERKVGALIYEKYKFPVDLENPRTTIYIDILNENCFIGIDLTGTKLSKRDYRVKTAAVSINPCVAYSLLKIADWKAKESLLDPFTRSGELVIEAALLATNTTPQKHIKDKLLIKKYYKTNFKDKEKPAKVDIHAVDEMMPNIRNTEINSKLAGVNKLINFSRFEIEWLDTKFKKASMDKIITYPPQISNAHPEEQLGKIYKDFFFMAASVLKKKGTMTLLMNKNLNLINKYSKEFKFKMYNTIQFSHSNFDFQIVQLKR